MISVTGVPSSGKRVSIGDGLTIHVPYGAVYFKDDDDLYSVFMLSPIPGNYKDGRFSINDDIDTLWKLSNISRKVVVEELEKISETEAKSKMEEFVKGVADAYTKSTDTAVTEDDKRKDEYSIEDDGVTFRSTLSIGKSGGSAGRIKTVGNVTHTYAEMKVRIGSMGEISYLFALAGVLNYPEAYIYQATMSISNFDKKTEIYEKRIAPVLESLEMNGSKGKSTVKLSQSTKKKSSALKSTSKSVPKSTSKSMPTQVDIDLQKDIAAIE